MKEIITRLEAELHRATEEKEIFMLEGAIVMAQELDVILELYG